MKNPGCANNRGSPPYASGNSSYQIPLLPNAPAAMMLKAKTAYGDDADPLSNRRVFRFIHFYMSGDTTETMEAGVEDHVWSLEELVRLLDQRIGGPAA
jgi:hypothetical protein